MDKREETFLKLNEANKDSIYATLTSKKRTYEQKVLDLAHQAENMLNVLKIDDTTLH